MIEYGECPVCKGAKRRLAGDTPYKKFIHGYDPVTDTLPCQNCGGQTMLGTPTGITRLRKDGTPCKHDFTGRQESRCYTVYTCRHCGYSYDIDSGD